jgi:hypothetical protein
MKTHGHLDEEGNVRADTRHTSFCNLISAASLSLALISTYIFPTSGFVLRIFSIRTDAEQQRRNEAQY